MNLVSKYLIWLIKNSCCISATIYFKKICFKTVISITNKNKILSSLKSSHKLSQKTHSFSGINNCTDKDTKIEIRFIKKIRFVNLPLYFIGETGNLIINYLVYLLFICILFKKKYFIFYFFEFTIYIFCLLLLNCQLTFFSIMSGIINSNIFFSHN